MKLQKITYVLLVAVLFAPSTSIASMQATAVSEQTLNERLAMAAKAGDAKKVEALIKAGADVNEKVNLLLPFRGTYTTALIEAAREGHVDVIQVLLKNCADINGKDYTGHTALMWASKEHLPVVRLLLDNHAALEIHSYCGMTALMYAAAERSPETVKLLLKHGAIVNAKDERDHSALWYALDAAWSDKQIRYDMVKLLLEHGARIDENIQRIASRTHLSYLSKLFNQFRQ